MEILEKLWSPNFTRSKIYGDHYNDLQIPITDLQIHANILQHINIDLKRIHNFGGPAS
jgi:hypothetical protein